MKGRKRAWSCSLHVKDNSEKPLPAHCSSLSTLPTPDREKQALLSPQGKGMLTPEMQPLEPSELGRGRYLALQVHHGLLEGFGRSSLVVTQNGHRSVGTVVGEDLCWDVVIRCEGQESGEHPSSPGCGATASVPQPLQNQPSPPLSSLNTALQLQSQGWPLPSQPPTPSGCSSSPLTPPQPNRGEAQPEQGTAGPPCPGHHWASQVQCAHLVKLQSARQHCSQGSCMSSIKHGAVTHAPALPVIYST